MKDTRKYYNLEDEDQETTNVLELGPTQISIIEEIRNDGPLSTRELADRLDKSQHAVRQAMTRMSDENFISSSKKVSNPVIPVYSINEDRIEVPENVTQAYAAD